MKLPELYQNNPVPVKDIDDMIDRYDALIAEIKHCIQTIENSIASPWIDVTGEDRAIKKVTAHFWNTAINDLGLLVYMSSAARSQWYKQIEDANCPLFQRDIVFRTFLAIHAERPMLLANSADDIFRRLSHSHVTNTPRGFRERMIFERGFDVGYMEASPQHDIVNTIDDLRWLLRWITTGEHDRHYRWDTYRELKIIRNQTPGEWQALGDSPIRARGYKKGTLHIELQEGAADSLNRLLAIKYPMVLTDLSGKRKASQRAHKPVSPMHDALPVQMVEALQAVRISGNSVALDSTWDKHLRDRMEQLFELCGAHISISFANFGYDPRAIIDHLKQAKQAPDVKSHQYYPTPGAIADKLCAAAGLNENHRILEPSCGSGNLVVEMPRGAAITAIEIDPLLAEITKARCKYAHVINDDFLELATELPEFDRIVMNPPFSEGRARAHVETAMQLLAPNGQLHAIVPEGFSLSRGVDAEEFQCSVSHAMEYEGVRVWVRLLKVVRSSAALAVPPRLAA